IINNRLEEHPVQPTGVGVPRLRSRPLTASLSRHYLGPLKLQPHYGRFRTSQRTQEAKAGGDAAGGREVSKNKPDVVAYTLIPGRDSVLRKKAFCSFPALRVGKQEMTWPANELCSSGPSSTFIVDIMIYTAISLKCHRPPETCTLRNS
ncbi:hypothetical protein STEG23_022814, partial [Scotinomys teguina]